MDQPQKQKATVQSSKFQLVEKVVLSRLLLYLEEQKLLTQQQHRFFRGRSTTTAIIQLP